MESEGGVEGTGRMGIGSQEGVGLEEFLTQFHPFGTGEPFFVP